MKYLFTSESVSGGHPDKLCDYVSDSILDACLEVDPDAKVACETASKGNMIMILGEISCAQPVNYEQVIRKAAKELGYDSWDIGLDYKNCQVIVSIDVQSREIGSSVHENKPIDEIGAGDQGFMMGYATNETEELMPLSYVLATKLLKKLDDHRKDKSFPWVRPDAKSQVTVEYEETNGHLKPLRVHTVLMSIQHSPEISTAEIRNQITTKLIKEVIPEKYLTPETKFVINPSESFTIGGPRADAGVTGRKIIVDSYGGWGGHGGGAFSGKDGTKVDRSGAYTARWIAKSLVHNKLCERCLIQIAYGIGIPDPISVNVNSYGTVAQGLTDESLVELVKKEFNLKPGRIIEQFKLKRPIYRKTTLYGHFLKNDPDLLWEVPKDLSNALSKK
jgi:S-adenosylmethionine synthetase